MQFSLLRKINYFSIPHPLASIPLSLLCLYLLSSLFPYLLPIIFAYPIFISPPLHFFLLLLYIKIVKMLFAGWTYSVGFISAEMIKDHLFPPSPDTLVLMCGPPPMINFACVPNLDKLGYDSKLRFAY